MAPILFKYDWEARRQHLEKVPQRFPTAGAPCARTSRAAPTTHHGFAFPRSENDLAAYVHRHEQIDGGTVLWLDITSAHGLDDGWSGVLLDESGHALHEWTCVEIDASRGTKLVVAIPLEQAKRYRHVALFIFPPPLKRQR